MPENARKPQSHLDLLHAARAAAAVAGAWLSTVEPPAHAAWGAKGARDFVTEVDRTAEAMVRDALLHAVPGSHVVGEELTPELRHDGVVWIVDPLDGTTNFLHRFPAWGVSVAAAMDGVVVAGVVRDVPRGLEYHAVAGGGAWRDGERLQVSGIAEPGLALIGTGFPFKDLSGFGDYLRQFEWIAARTAGIRRAGSAALDLCAVAAGAFEGFWEQRLAPWDVAAGALLVREAGGKVTDFAGRDIGVEHGAVLAGNPAIHRWMVEGLKGEK